MLAARALRGQARRATALTTTRSIGYKRVLVVVKFTPYEAYTQLKLQGKAPKALRWERLQGAPREPPGVRRAGRERREAGSR